MNIRFFVILLSCALFGLLVLQFHWLKMALDTQKERFRQQVHSGLSEVARKLDEREFTYDITQFAQNTEEDNLPKDLCVNEDSLIKPKKMVDNMENMTFNASYFAQQNQIESERINVEAQRKKAEMEILHAEKIKKELMSKKSSLNFMLLLHKTQRYINKQFLFSENNSYANTKNINRSFPENSHANYSQLSQKEKNFVKPITTNEQEYNNETENKFIIGKNDINNQDFLKDLEKMGYNFGKDFAQSMQQFELDMEEFGKKMEKLDFEMVTVENVIKTRKGDLVIALGNTPKTSKKKQKDFQKTLKKDVVYNAKTNVSNKNTKNSRKDNKRFVFSNHRAKDTIKYNFVKGGEFNIVLNGNTHIKGSIEPDDTDDEEQNDFFEKNNAPDPVVLPKETSHFPVAQPNIILPTTAKKIPQIQEKDQIVKHFLENLEEKKKNPNQMFETRQKLENRLRFDLLDSLIKAEMRLRGIDIPYDFVVERRSANDIQRLRNPKNTWKTYLTSRDEEIEKGDSLHKIFFEKNVKTTEKIIKAGFYTPIFAFRNTGNRYFLHLDFSQQHSLLLRNMIEMLLSSLALIALVIYCFVKAIRTILKQKKMSEMTTDFINNMTHELKTPIATVALACEALQDKDMMDKLPHQRSRYINMIQEENQRLQTQVEKVLHIAKLDKGEIALQYEQVDLNEILPEITAQMALQVESRGGKIELELNATHNLLYSDKNHLSHIVLNLLDNANKYSPEKPNILVKTQDTETGVKISVIDHGQGMTKDQQCKVFDKFYRVSTGNIHNVKGFGLGLSYVKTMTEALGGKVSVKSELGKGSMFEVEFKS